MGGNKRNVKQMTDSKEQMQKIKEGEIKFLEGYKLMKKEVV